MNKGGKPRSAKAQQKLFRFSTSTETAPEDYVGYEIVKELTSKCSEVYADGSDLVAKLLNGTVVRVVRRGDFLTPYRDLLKEIGQL